VQNAGPQDAEFLERDALDRELTRVFEKCHDCRRCLPLCPSFPALFRSVDRHDQEAAQLTDAERREVIDLCYQCKLCYNHCPYHPPHEWEIDFPKLMSRAKIVQAREEGIPLADRMGQQLDLMGKVSCMTAPLTNLAFKNRAVRMLMEPATGIDRRWIMPRYESKRLSSRLRSRTATRGENGRAILFATCFVEYSEAETGVATAEVLEHCGIAVNDGYEACCGAPFLHGGDIDSAVRNAGRVIEQLAPQVKDGTPIVVPGPHLPREFARPLGRVAYHLPCHLKSQNIGFRSRQLLKAAGAEVEMLDMCSGVDGTWGMKKRWYDQSLGVAAKLLDGVRESEAEHVATDCPLAALRIQEGTGRRAVHPIVLIRDAYGLGGSA
jgi:Fe-S oxidoreductase